MVEKLKLSVLYTGVRRAGFDYVINILMPSSKNYLRYLVSTHHIIDWYILQRHLLP